MKKGQVIFICTFDPFEKGLAQYSFENLCDEDTTIRLNDGTKKIFFNATDYDKVEDEDVREFLRYVNGEKSDNSFVQTLMREQDVKDEIRQEDIRKLIASLRFYNIPDEGILQQLMERYQLTAEEASAFLNQE